MDRRKFSMAISSSLLAFSGVSGLANRLIGQDDRKGSPNEKSPAELITPEAQKAIDKGLAYLVGRQIKNGRNRGAFGNSSYSAGVATASLGGLAMMASGCAPGQGKYGRSIDANSKAVMLPT